MDEEAQFLDVHVAEMPDISAEELSAAYSFLVNKLNTTEYPTIVDGSFRPHETLADLMCRFSNLEFELMLSKEVYAKAMEDNAEAADQMLRIQDLIQSLLTIQQLINRAYYSATALLVHANTNDNLYQALEAASIALDEEAVATD